MKRIDHRFGSDWTKDKLDRLQRYLIEYVKIMKKNERARFFKICYVDAFAGTGYIKLKSEEMREEFEGFLEQEVQEYLTGSAVRALETEPSFDEFIFIEKKGTHVEQLHLLRDEFPDLAERIKIVPSDANEYLINWCQRFPRRTQRAVIFLDPYGMQVEW